MPQGEGEVLGVFVPTGLNGIFFAQKCIRLVHDKLSIFRKRNPRFIGFWKI